MTLPKFILCTAMVSVLAACGGGGGGSAAAGGGGGGTGGMPRLDDPPIPAPSQTYQTLASKTGTVPLTGAILVGGSSVDDTTGTIDLAAKTFTATGVSGATSLGASSPFDLPDYTFARDVAISSGSVAIVGVSTATADLRQTGSAAYTGDFAGQLVDGSQITATTLNWDADIQINFAGNGDVDMTFTGGGSDLIDTIRIMNATVTGNTFAGGTIRTFNNGAQNNISGTAVNMNGAFYGYNTVLQLPGEVGGAIVSQDTNTDISGVFIATAKP